MIRDFRGFQAGSDLESSHADISLGQGTFFKDVLARQRHSVMTGSTEIAPEQRLRSFGATNRVRRWLHIPRGNRPRAASGEARRMSRTRIQRSSTGVERMPGQVSYATARTSSRFSRYFSKIASFTKR